MERFQGPKGTESIVHYFQILGTYEATNLFKIHPLPKFVILKMLCNILTFHSYISGVYFGGFL